jgi:hypothetical protein
MSERTKNSFGAAHLLTFRLRHARSATHARQLLGFAACLTLALCGFTVMAQEPGSAGTLQRAEPTIAETQNRVIFDAEALFDHAVPYWSDGYLVASQTESFSAATPNVTLFGRNGSKSLDATFWFPGSQRVAVTSAAVSHRGGVLASGEADKADGTRALFVALANAQGQVSNVIQTGDFYPRNVCEAPDGSIWAFGGMMQNPSTKEALPGNILRRFDLEKGETASYIPRSTFPARIQVDTLSFIRCSKDAVVVYSNPANVLIELQYAAKTPRIYHISVPKGLQVVGFAITNSGDAFGALDMNADDGREGMYRVVLDGEEAAHWQAVRGAVGNLSEEGIVSHVWGADGDSLVVSRGGSDSAGIARLHWVTIGPKQ